MLKFYLYTILLLVFCIIFFRAGINSVLSHGLTWHLIIPPICVYLILKKLLRIESLHFKPSTHTGSILLIVASALQLCGKITSTSTFCEMAFLIALWGTVLFIVGISGFKLLLWPLLYLFFFLKVSDGIFSFLTLFFQIYTTKISCFLANFCGFQVANSDTYIRLPAMVLNVARECSGVNHLISLFCMSVPLACVTQSTSLQRSLIIISSLPFALLANSIRVFALIIYNFNRTDFTHGPGNIFITGFGFFLGLSSMVLLVIFLSKFNPTIAKTTTLTVHNKNQSTFSDRVVFHYKNLAIYCLIVITGFLLPLVWINKQSTIQQLNPSIFNLESCTITTQRTFEISDSTLPHIFQIFSIKRNNKLYGNLFVGHYSNQGNGNEAASYSFNKLFTQTYYNSYCSVSKKMYRYTLGTITNDSINRYLITYKIGNHYDNNPYRIKYHLLLKAIMKHSNDATIFILSYENGSNHSEDHIVPFFFNSIIPAIDSALNKL